MQRRHGGGVQQQAASIPVDAKTKVRKLHWSTTSPAVTGGLLQVSAKPFNNAWPAPPGKFPRRVEKSSFLVDFDAAFGNDRIEKLTAAGVVNADYSMQATRNTAPLNRSAVRPPVQRNRVSQEAVFARIAPRLNLNVAGFIYQPTWYVRVVPLEGDRIAGRPTNEVVVKSSRRRRPTRSSSTCPRRCTRSASSPSNPFGRRTRASAPTR